jgi:hypothetical protein
MDKQLFAKIGVFVLLGLNVAAYYVFWPSQHGASKSEAKAPKEEKGEVQLLPTQPNLVMPNAFPASAAVAVPLSIPTPPKSSERDVGPDDAVNKLLAHIRKEAETSQGSVQAQNEKGPDPLFPGDNKPKPLPLLKAEPIMVDPNVGVTSALTPKTPPSPWLLNMEAVGNQTLLIARLREPASGQQVAELRILCDRVEPKAAGGVHALGNVTFTGAGMKGACRRLIVPTFEPQLLFEEQVYLTQDGNPAASLRGDRIAWELPVEANRPGLGAPK